ncbi:MAG: Fur family transcriptional regulator [Candidatus Saccharimonadales bacterium]
MNAFERFTKKLRDVGQSVTKARVALFQLLENAEPQSTAELLSRAAGQFDRASLYRSLALFEELGIVQRLYIGFKYKIELTDMYSHHHHHVSCLKCGKVMPLSEHEQIERMITLLAKRHGVRATSHQLEIQGYCNECEA